MDVVTLNESLNHGGIVAEISHKPQLNLRIVSRKEHISRCGDKRFAYFTAVVAAHRDILHIRIGRRESSGSRDSLVICGVNTPGCGVYQLGQSIHIGGEQLAHAAITQYAFHNGVTIGEFHQHLLSGSVLSATRLLRLRVELQLAKHNLSHLCRRTHIKFLTGKLVALSLNPGKLSCKDTRILLKRAHIYTHARNLHIGKHGNERNLHIVQQALHAIFLHTLLKKRFQAQCVVGKLAGIVAHHIIGKSFNGRITLALGACERCKQSGGVTNQDLRQAFYGVRSLGLHHIVSHGGIEVVASKRHAHIVQKHHVALHVATHQRHRSRIGKSLNTAENGITLLAESRNRHIHTLAATCRKSHTEHGGTHGVGIGGCYVDSHLTARGNIGKSSVYLSLSGSNAIAIGSLLGFLRGSGSVAPALSHREESAKSHIGRFSRLLGSSCGFFERFCRLFGCRGSRNITAEDSSRERAEFELVEHSHQPFAVDRLALHISLVEFHRHIGGNGGKEFRETYLLGILRHLQAHRALNLRGVLNEVFNRAKLLQQLDGGLFAHSGTTGNVIHLISHKGKYVDHL